MGVIVELARAKQRIRELEALVAVRDEDIAELLEQLALGTEKPSPADIVRESAIGVFGNLIEVDLLKLNIPFTKAPKVLPMGVPDTNSMDGLFDYGNSNLYLEPADETNHLIMINWIAKQWNDSQGLQTVDAVYRIMENETDDPKDFTKPHKFYAIHRLVKVTYDDYGRLFWFAGVNNPVLDPYFARDTNILWLNIGTIF